MLAWVHEVWMIWNSNSVEFAELEVEVEVEIDT
jgi:hypothetical protein